MTWIMWIHPAMQALATLIGMYVLYHGAKRFYCVICSKKKPFAWKQHVFWGRIAVLLWFSGLIVGAAAARHFWTTLGATGNHYVAGLIMLPLLLFSYASGEIMDRKKKKRKVLPLLHAFNNFTLFGLAIYQAITGYHLLSWLP